MLSEIWEAITAKMNENGIVNKMYFTVMHRLR